MNKHQSAMQNNLESIAHFVDETAWVLKQSACRMFRIN